MELVVGRTTVDLQGCVDNEFFIAILILAMVHCVKWNMLFPLRLPSVEGNL